MTFETQLDAKVYARNRVAQKINELAPALIAALTPFVGQKVMKIGGMVQKVQAIVDSILPANGPGAEFHIYRYGSDYSLTWTVKLDAFYKQGNPRFADYTPHISVEESFYVGHLQGAILEKMYENTPRRTDYTVHEVKAARLALEAAKAAVSKAQSALCPFDEFDRA